MQAPAGEEHQRLRAPHAREEPHRAAAFPAFTGQAPAPRGRPGAIVVLDDPAAREAEAVRRAFDRAGLGRRRPPPRSPDLDPVEQAWPRLEARPRAEAARDARGWFRLCGYGPAN